MIDSKVLSWPKLPKRGGKSFAERKAERKLEAPKPYPTPWRDTPINPRTGEVWRISDPELKPAMDELERELRDPEKARAFLQERGFITADGRLHLDYGGARRDITSKHKGTMT